VIRPVRGEGTRACPSALTRRSLRIGAPAAMRVYRLASLTIGAGLGVADPYGEHLLRTGYVFDSFIQNIT
jgi:hypothetical protein